MCVQGGTLFMRVYMHYMGVYVHVFVYVANGNHASETHTRARIHIHTHTHAHTLFWRMSDLNSLTTSVNAAQNFKRQCWSRSAQIILCWERV